MLSGISLLSSDWPQNMLGYPVFFLILVIFKFSLLIFISLAGCINSVDLFKELPLCGIDFLYCFIVSISLIAGLLCFVFFFYFLPSVHFSSILLYFM